MRFDFFADGRAHGGLDSEQYLQLMAEQAEADPAGLDEEAVQRIEYTRLNLHRTRRIERTYRPDEELARLVRAIDRPQLWMVLTEPWCGDSAQCLPHLAVLAGLNPAITLRLILRDTNLDIMDHFLTGTSRSIPRLVAFAEDGEVVFQWGPRPAAAQEVFDQARAEGLAKPELLERLHLFYGRNRGRALEDEFIALLKG
jgi:hypothetical protein